MVSGKDVALFIGISLIASVVLVIGAGVDLPGSNTVKDIISQPENKPTTTYKMYSEIRVGTDGFADNSFKYKTEKSSSFLSLTSSGVNLNFIGAKNVEVEYVLKDSKGRIVASDSKFLGKISAFETKDVTFETNNLGSGEYEVSYLVSFQKCDLFTCTGDTDTFSKTVSVPKFPLGEY